VTDAIDLSRADLHASPDVRAWPITTAITRLDFGKDVAVTFDKQATWPEVIPAGWDGGIQYTLWLFLQIQGVWHGAAVLAFWKGGVNGGDVTQGRQVALNWLYPSGFGPLQFVQPGAGESVGFMVTAGNARFDAVTPSLSERSNVVLVPFPSQHQTFTFAAAPVPPVPDPGPILPAPGIPSAPAPTPVPSSNPPEYVAAILERLGRVESALVADLAKAAPVYRGSIFGYTITLTPEARK
jgi:hypothetical protein